MYCRYIRVLAKCSKMAAEWQLMFTHHVTNTFPGIYQYAVGSKGADVIHINECQKFLPGFVHL